jgi:carbon-monoxide dehydrogenase small subunit
MALINITVNGRRAALDIQPRINAADMLREHLRLTGTHLGCEHGVCGACTVLIDGVPVRSCIVLAVACDGKDLRTIEGFEASDPVMDALRLAFQREHGLQCGFCTPGMLVAARDIVLRLPDADEHQIRRELSGNLCRCTGYVGIVKAVRSVIVARHGQASPAGRAPRVSSQAAELVETLPVAAKIDPSEPTPADEGERSRAGWTHFSQSFVVDADVDAVWKLLSDFPLIASCLPGAELAEYDDNHLKGRMAVKLGPIRAAFAGSASVARDDARRIGQIRGAGNDRGSGSRTRANATYIVEKDPGSGSRVSIAVEYNLQGPLAQFSRSGLAQEVGRLLVQEFAANLNSRLRGNQAGTIERNSAPLKVSSVVGAIVKHWLSRLFGRRGQ